jgi:hypothetical protein
MHEDREACTIDSFVFVVVAAADDDDNDNNDYGEKEIVRFITYYFASTCSLQQTSTF